VYIKSVLFILFDYNVEQEILQINSTSTHYCSSNLCNVCQLLFLIALATYLHGFDGSLCYHSSRCFNVVDFVCIYFVDQFM